MKNITVDTKKRILLIGASGTVGFETLKHLVKNPHYEITVFDVKTRKSVKKLSLFQSRVEIVYGDISNVSEVEKVSRNKDVAIHLAAIIPPLADINPELAYRVNVKGTENLIHALQKNSPQCYLLFSSSISVYGDRICSPEISVTDPLKPSIGDQYGETKVLCEKAILQSNLSWSVFRLAAIMGNHKISKLMFHMPLDTPMEICTPEDTGRAFANAIGFQSQLENRIFNLGGGEDCVISYRSFLEKMFDAFGLGDANFPEKAFAEKNFHCGILFDGDQLEKIIRFRRQSLADYFEMVHQQIHPFQKKITFLFRNFIKRWLLSQSEPYRAYWNGNESEIDHFFNKDEKKIVEPAYK
ncbi:nucleoside-diphosphate-sugar epimerase [Chryseobacterium ginsenosidimutans]|uniref:NAD-dependent epimerase/dehydratase family protein n=1 Tax=Chryseobacterium ginsenosidimutans TaxID=687846 RepID=UPI002787909F|nr:NAD(P)-dependent oxidoreductase [Chryseobacterium ginsenosidimutans]MDQ0594385.1 nucleoside-diphosphate-sugar epimerase [Chryseobacterium ginsenosidimutans]